MKNKELLNICYKFFNRFITAEVLIEQLSNMDKTNLSESNIKETNKLIKDIKKIADDIPDKIDSYERWFEIADCINQNNYFNKTFESLTDYELLEFIAQNIQAPFPPKLTQEEFDKLVKAGIEKDEREWLWRLAFNYEDSNINFDGIIDYFISKKDGYYLAELISVIGASLDIDSIINKINDSELIEDLKERKEVIRHFVSEEQLNSLINKILL